MKLRQFREIIRLHNIESAKAEEISGDHRRNDGGDDKRGKKVHREISKNDLGRKDRTGNWSIVRASQTGSRAAGDQQTQTIRRPFAKPPYFRGERSAQLDNGTFPSDACACANADQGGDGLNQSCFDGELAVSRNDY